MKLFSKIIIKNPNSNQKLKYDKAEMFNQKLKQNEKQN